MHEAVDFFVHMMENGFQSDRYSMSSTLSSTCTELGSFRSGQQLHSLEYVIWFGVMPLSNKHLAQQYQHSVVLRSTVHILR